MFDNDNYNGYKDAFIEGKMYAYAKIMSKIKDENALLNDIVEYINNNEQYIEWNKE